MTPFGPLFQKEMLEASRRWRYYLLRTFLGALTLVVLVLWGTSNPQRLSSITAQSKLGHQLFTSWLMVQYLLLAAATPVVVGGLIAAERDKGSLDLLFTTHLSSWEIVWGKLASRLAILLLVMFSSTPVVVMLGLFGGVDFEMLLVGTSLTAATVAAGGAVGLYYSLTTRKPWIAAVRTFAFFAMVWGALPFLLLMGYALLLKATGSAATRPPTWFLSSVLNSSPPLLFRGLVEGWGFFGMFSRARMLESAALWTAFSALVLPIAVLRLRRPLPRDARPLLLRLVSGAWNGLTGLMRRPRAGAASTGRFARFEQWLADRNPVAWRNRKSRVFDPDRHIAGVQHFAVLLGAALFAIVLALETRLTPTLSQSEEWSMALFFECAFLQLLLVVMIAVAVSREQERGTLDLLWMTPLRPWQILVGNAYGAIVEVTPTFLAICGTIILISLKGGYSSEFAFAYGILLPLTTAKLVAMALLLSTALQRVAPSLVGALAVGGGYWMLGFVVAVCGPRTTGVLAGTAMIAGLVAAPAPKRERLAAATTIPIALALLVVQQDFNLLFLLALAVFALSRIRWYAGLIGATLASLFLASGLLCNFSVLAVEFLGLSATGLLLVERGGTRWRAAGAAAVALFLPLALSCIGIAPAQWIRSGFSNPMAIVDPRMIPHRTDIGTVAWFGTLCDGEWLLAARGRGWEFAFGQVSWQFAAAQAISAMLLFWIAARMYPRMTGRGDR